MLGKNRNYIGFIVFIIILMYISISIGSKDINIHSIINAIKNNSNDIKDHIIRDIKVPRAIGALLVGCFLAVAGAIMQSITKNSLADPTIMGISDGAMLGLTFGILITGNNTSYIESIFFSLGGALITTSIVFFISKKSKGKSGKVKLVLAGTALGMFFKAISNAISIRLGFDQNLKIWYSSGVVGVKWIGILILLVGVIGVVIALVYSKKFTILSLGEEIAIGLGQDVKKIRNVGIFSVVIITGVTVAVVGNIPFIGLVIPNICKILVGEDYKKIIPMSAFMGSTLFILADIVSRFVNTPYETPVGAITSLIGVPFFLYLVNKKEVKVNGKG